MSVKTFVIKLPKPLPPGAQVKGVVTPQMLSELTTTGKSTTMDFSGNMVQFVKEEPAQIIEVNENEKPVRKRQKLDHLTYEEKLMRRKLKNRVAAQTARDRKKVRMEELELQVNQMVQQMSKMSNLVDKLSQHNEQLEEENTILRNRPSQCTCNTLGASVTKPISFRHVNTVQERKTPVCGVTEKSAEGSHTAGSSTLGLISKNRIVLSVGNGPTNESITIQGKGIVRKNRVPLTLSIKRSSSEMDVAPPATMELQPANSVSLNHDSDATSGTDVKNPNLTTEEERIIAELTKALEETMSTPQQVPTTPELLDLLQFQPTVLASDSAASSVMTPPSPITKEEILDFLQGHESSPEGCPTGSESGYDTIHSPFSLSSDHTDDFSLEQDECNSSELFQLFPCLLDV